MLECCHVRREGMPKYFLCPLTNRVPDDPFLAEDGRYYDFMPAFRLGISPISQSRTILGLFASLEQNGTLNDSELYTFFEDTRE